jgi:hypothetical protein
VTRTQHKKGKCQTKEMGTGPLGPSARNSPVLTLFQPICIDSPVQHAASIQTLHCDGANLQATVPSLPAAAIAWNGAAKQNPPPPLLPSLPHLRIPARVWPTSRRARLFLETPRWGSSRPRSSHGVHQGPAYHDPAHRTPLLPHLLLFVCSFCCS